MAEPPQPQPPQLQPQPSRPPPSRPPQPSRPEIGPHTVVDPAAGEPAVTSGAGKPAAVVAVVVNAGRVLVVKRAPQVLRPGYWAPLSGRVEPGEQQRDTVVREVREEVGLAVRPRALVWECDTDDGSFRLYWWTAELIGGRLTPDPREVSEVRWVTPDEFAGLSPTFADDHVFFETVLPTLGVI